MTPIRIAGSTIGEPRHVCALFNTPEEEYRTLLPFVRDGLDGGDRAVHVVESRQRDRHLARLRDAGIDVERAQSAGQLEARTTEETYLGSGRFDQDAMLALVRAVLDAGAGLGFPRTRLLAHAELVFEDWQGASDFLEYEARLNDVLPAYRDVIVCTYDASRLDAGIALDVLRTHPMVIIGRVLHENPFYMAPDAFLREVRERGPRPNAPPVA